tara:strand:+ start:172 stop:540 length:369 start_codon:yes stop_codon:yes gene_type:complete
MKITILKENKNKKVVKEALPALVAAAPAIASAIGSVLDDESEETAEEIIGQSEARPLRVQAHGDEFRSIKRILQAIQAQLIKMGGSAPGGDAEAAGNVPVQAVDESLKEVVHRIYLKKLKKS